MKRRTGSPIAPLIALALVVAVGCRSIAPLDDPLERPTSDASTDLDAAFDPDAALSPCMQCIEAPRSPGPGCGDVWEKCLGYPVCASIVFCADRAGCFAGATPQEIVQCALPCATATGEQGSNPAGPVLLDLAKCAPACAARCGRDAM